MEPCDFPLAFDMSSIGVGLPSSTLPSCIEGIISDIVALLIPPFEQANGTFMQLILQSLKCKLRCTGPGLNEHGASLLLEQGSGECALASSNVLGLRVCRLVKWIDTTCSVAIDYCAKPHHILVHRMKHYIAKDLLSMTLPSSS